jgi:molybdate transport system ATP-binding protein
MARDVKNLSGGEKQRVSLARTLSSSPDILLLDEPLVSVDSFSRNYILKTLRDVHKQFQIPIIYVTHSFSEILTFADYILFMKFGKTTRYGELRKLFWEVEGKEFFDNEELQTVLEVCVLENFIDKGITKSSVNGSVFSMPLVNKPKDSIVNIAIHARDVILANHPIEGISARNIFSATITDMKSLGRSVIVLSDINGVSIMSEITHESVDSLGLEIGDLVYLIIKTNSIYIQPDDDSNL